jgi:glycosyltransferase involved in cell wall biosynthesis
VRIVVLNWRDTANPEGGGSEVYIERIARRWAARGHAVTLVCAAHDGGPAMELVQGVRIVRIGTKLRVYGGARRLLRSGALGGIDVIVDTQNGIPFFSPWASSAPTVVLVHHVHREQWPVVYDPLRARLGWFVESTVAPRAYRGCAYVAVSEATRAELISLGVRASDIAVVHNGVDAPAPSDVQPDREPRILVLGRLVPHKRIEHVIVAASVLRSRHPGLRIAVVGDGWWSHELEEAARSHGVEDIVEFHGHVDDAEKYRQIARSWVLALPSLKEGWGLVVMEAASLGVPSVAYADAGGVTESIVDGETGLLVAGGVDDFAQALERLVDDAPLRQRLGSAARERARRFSWDASADAFEDVLAREVEAAERTTSSSSRRRRRGRRR